MVILVLDYKLAISFVVAFELIVEKLNLNPSTIPSSRSKILREEGGLMVMNGAVTIQKIWKSFQAIKQ